MPDADRTPVYRPGIGDETGRLILRHDGKGEIVGVLEYRFGPADTCEVVNFDVREGHRGQGHGTSMIEELSRMERSGTLYLFCMKANTRALNLYRRLGFETVDLPGYYGKAGDGVLAWRVRKAGEKWG